MRASVGIAQLALQQIEDDLTAGDMDGHELAAILDELQEDVDTPGGLLPMLAQVVSTAARRAEHIEPDRDGDASCPLHEAAALIADTIGPRLNCAARSLNSSQGDLA
ncbi:hypothetical protein [Streptomyces nigra]|uniref:hypothetical protein n=1 Tax=Streptomyces nigra TaxID=1827580 RepID=UPI00380D5987